MGEIRAKSPQERSFWIQRKAGVKLPDSILCVASLKTGLDIRPQAREKSNSFRAAHERGVVPYGVKLARKQARPNLAEDANRYGKQEKQIPEEGFCG